MNPRSRHRVIFDTDPGVDDAMALYFALAHPDIELVGITTTFGNVRVEQAVQNALYLCQIAGRTVPVARGLASPWVKPGEAPPEHIHGADGLGNLPSRQALRAQADPRSAAQFIVDAARERPGEISLVAVGPLGNLAAALKLEPALPGLLRGVVLMGGTVLEPGNVSPVAEANIWNDPHAADIVFTAGWPLTMVGLDVTHRLILPVTLFREIARHHQHLATDTLLHAVDFYAHFYSQRFAHVGQVHGCFGHDVLAFIRLVAPGLFGTVNGPVRVATEGPAAGQTILKRLPELHYPHPGWEPHVPCTEACMSVDATAAADLFRQTLLGDWLTR
ncbi:MAG: nucleoside hydrolase [Rhodoferax sp.]|nr:nucleoside hydrolase [Rhodoferax sp.]